MSQALHSLARPQVEFMDPEPLRIAMGNLRPSLLGSMKNISSLRSPGIKNIMYAFEGKRRHYEGVISL